MIARGFGKLLVCLAGVTLLSTAARAQSPTSLAESSAEYNAYVYSYTAKVYANGLADELADDGIEGEVALLISDFCDEGFFHCYDALVDDNNSLWAEAVDDLDLALYWCDTLLVFTQNSQPASIQNEINTLMMYLEIAIQNAEAAKPQLKRLPTRQRFFSSR